MFAWITIFYTADPSPHFEPEVIHRLLVRVLEVLPKMDGYKGATIVVQQLEAAWEALADQFLNGSRRNTRNAYLTGLAAAANSLFTGCRP